MQNNKRKPEELCEENQESRKQKPMCVKCSSTSNEFQVCYQCKAFSCVKCMGCCKYGRCAVLLCDSCMKTCHVCKTRFCEGWPTCTKCNRTACLECTHRSRIYKYQLTFDYITLCDDCAKEEHYSKVWNRCAYFALVLECSSSVVLRLLEEFEVYHVHYGA